MPIFPGAHKLGSPATWEALIGSVAGTLIPELWGSGVLSVGSVIWSGSGRGITQ
jgi:hypothetical protein